MQEQQTQTDDQETFINIRKLAALDVVLHGRVLVLIEFAGALVVCAGLGAFSLHYFFAVNNALFALLLGVVLCWIALNYVPLLLYAIDISRRKSAQQEVAFELEHR